MVRDGGTLPAALCGLLRSMRTRGSVSCPASAANTLPHSAADSNAVSHVLGIWGTAHRSPAWSPVAQQSWNQSCRGLLGLPQSDTQPPTLAPQLTQRCGPLVTWRSAGSAAQSSEPVASSAAADNQQEQPHRRKRHQLDGQMKSHWQQDGNPTGQGVTLGRSPAAVAAEAMKAAMRRGDLQSVHVIFDPSLEVSHIRLYL